MRMAEKPLDSTVQTARLGILRRIYDWCIDAADKPYALWILGAVSFAESSFFPVPPDIMLLPMSLARPRQAWVFATLCTVASVAGGVCELRLHLLQQLRLFVFLLLQHHS